MTTKEIHPLFREMINTLPPAGSYWPAESQRHWVQTMLACFELIFDHRPKQRSKLQGLVEQYANAAARALGDEAVS